MFSIRLRDPWSGFTHFVGVLLSIVALIMLLNRSFGAISTTHIVSFSIFGSGMILLYLASTLYHWLPLKGDNLILFRKIDHIMIFVFIASTYTPICLISLKGAWGWSIFGVVWGITLIGMFVKIFWMNAPRWISTGIYLIMGWIVIVAIWPLTEAMASSGLIWLAIGGLFYSIGAVIYATKKPDPLPMVFGYHEIFHVFVMLGSASHFIMIYYYI